MQRIPFLNPLRTALLAGAILSLLLILPRTADAESGEPKTGHEQPQLSKESTLEDYLRIAAGNSPGLRAAYEHWMSASSRVAEEKGWPDPVISYGYFIESVETAVGPQQHRIALSQTIPWFGKLSARGSAAESTALAAEQAYLAERLRLFDRVAQAYYAYAYLAEAIRITGENLQLLANHEAVARARYRTQSAAYSDLIKAQVEQGVLDDRLRTLSDRRGSRAARLNETLGRAADAKLPWPASLDEPQFSVPTEDEVRRVLLENNPQLRSLEYQISGTQSRVDAVHRQGLPDFTVGVQTILTGESDLTSFEGQGKDAWIASVSLRLPLWRGQYKGAEDAARADWRSLEHRYHESRLDLLAKAEELLFETRDSQRKIDLYGNSLLPKARQAMEATATAFQTGSAGFLDFIDAQRTLLQFELDHARARSDYGQQVVGIARLMGEAPIELSLASESSTNGSTGSLDESTNERPEQ